MSLAGPHAPGQAAAGAPGGDPPRVPHHAPSRSPSPPPKRRQKEESAEARAARKGAHAGAACPVNKWCTPCIARLTGNHAHQCCRQKGARALRCWDCSDYNHSCPGLPFEAREPLARALAARERRDQSAFEEALYETTSAVAAAEPAAPVATATVAANFGLPAAELAQLLRRAVAALEATAAANTAAAAAATSAAASAAASVAASVAASAAAAAANRV